MAQTIGPDEMFELFVLQQQQWTMVSLGKLVSPLSGETARDLDTARFSIDLLGMLQQKTRGNLSPNEERLLDSVLTNLRLNFIEESGRQVPAEAEAPRPGATGAEERDAV